MLNCCSKEGLFTTPCSFLWLFIYFSFLFQLYNCIHTHKHMKSCYIILPGQQRPVIHRVILTLLPSQSSFLQYHTILLHFLVHTCVPLPHVTLHDPLRVHGLHSP